MPYRFALASVLKLRESLEEILLRRLEQTQLEIAHTLQLLEGLQAHILSTMLSRQSDLAAGTAGADLHFGESVLRQLRSDRQELEEKLAQLRARRRQQLHDYEDARNKRQVLKDLRDRQRSEYENRVAHREQQMADDSFLARKGRG